MDFLGRIAGAPGELADTAKANGYLRALAAASPRARVFTIGRSEEGREILMLAIADEAGIRDLDRLKAATAALADPRRTTPEQAERADRGRAADLLPERGAARRRDRQHRGDAGAGLPAARLGAADDPAHPARTWWCSSTPSPTPTGATAWSSGSTASSRARPTTTRCRASRRPTGPNYAFVDINRDAHQLDARDRRRPSHRMFHEYHPTVVHDLHEAIALLLTWNGTGPYNPNLDPITTSEFLEMSFHEVRDADGARHARRVDVEVRRGLRPALPRLGRESTTTPSAAATRPGATPPPRRVRRVSSTAVAAPRREW